MTGNRIVWGRNTSSNVMKVLWGLGELGLPFERIDVGGAFGKTDTPEYRAMNPTGLVPTLQEGDFTLWESNAILRYLAQAHARAPRCGRRSRRHGQHRPLDGRPADRAQPAHERGVLGPGPHRRRKSGT